MTHSSIPLHHAPSRCCFSWGEVDKLGRLAAPLAAANLGQVLLGAVDTAVVGRLGATELGAGGLGSSLFFLIAVGGSGLLLGFDPLLAQAMGRGERERARLLVRSALTLAQLLAVPLLVLGVGVGVTLGAVGLAPETVVLTRGYLFVRLWGLVPYLGFVVARSYLQATGNTAPVWRAVVVANVVNVPVSWVLAWGDVGLERWGLPACGLPTFGVAGAAAGSVVSTVVQLLVLLAAVERDTIRSPVPTFDRRAVAQALRLGAPVAAAMLAEYGSFALANLLMGALAERALAAHQVALTFAATTFTVSLAIGAAAAVRVGQAVGGQDPVATRRSGNAALGLVGGLMALPALALAIAPEALASLVTDRVEIVAAAAPLLLVAALFQLADGLQAVAAGALRGAGDTRFAFVSNLAGHYLVGLPLGVFLAFGFGWGAVGLWWGLCAGLTAVAVSLCARFWRLSRRPIVPVDGRPVLASVDR